MRSTIIAILLCTVVIILGGCGTQLPTGAAQPRPSRISSTGPTVPDYGAPEVAHPLDAQVFLKAPCSTLAQSQLDALNLHTGGKPRLDGPLGPECNWNDISGATMGNYLAIFIKGGQGLSGAYSNRNGGFFQEIPPIDGYPAVISMAADGRSQGDCNVAIGLNDHLSVGVGAVMIKGAPNFANPCGVAAKIAEKMIATMKGAQ